jgi:hypothetical protein
VRDPVPNPPDWVPELLNRALLCDNTHVLGKDRTGRPVTAGLRVQTAFAEIQDMMRLATWLCDSRPEPEWRDLVADWRQLAQTVEKGLQGPSANNAMLPRWQQQMLSRLAAKTREPARVALGTRMLAPEIPRQTPCQIPRQVPRDADMAAQADAAIAAAASALSDMTARTRTLHLGPVRLVGDHLEDARIALRQAQGPRMRDRPADVMRFAKAVQDACELAGEMLKLCEARRVQ